MMLLISSSSYLARILSLHGTIYRLSSFIRLMLMLMLICMKMMVIYSVD